MISDPALVILDCDGTLVDSERISMEVSLRTAREIGVELTPDDFVEKFVGKDGPAIVAMLNGLVGKRHAKRWLKRFWAVYPAELAARLTPVDGVPEVLEALAGRGIPVCVASNSGHEHIRRALHATGLMERFEGRVFSAHDVAAGKPAPDLFLHAAATFSVAPERCVVVEDSRFGIQAARAAGMRAFGYAGGVTPGDWLEGPGTVVFDDMRKLPALLR